MKMNQKRPLKLAAVVICLAAFGCGKAEEIKREQAFEQGELRPGTYRSEKCFKNKVNLGNQYALADVTFNANAEGKFNGTGSAVYQLFSDVNCTVKTGDQSLTFAEASIAQIAGVSVIRLKQNAPVADPIWWIPANLSGPGYSLDVDHTDGESGPYIIEPSEADLSSFKAQPGQGISFKKI